MANGSRSTVLEDPLQGYSALSLFPRTLKALANPLPRPYGSDDLQHTHDLLKSMVSEDESQGIEADPIANKRERRPGLDRKKARFSFKPTTSQPTASSEPSFNASKYQNPEDFFLAYEKFENAKREWQKQTGTTLTDANHNQPSRRPRRPGIPGMKPIKYKHLYSSTDISQEALEEEILSPSENNWQQGTSSGQVASSDEDLADSVMETEKKVNDLLGELLACTRNGLDGDGLVNLLEERLKIKTIEVEKLSLPEMQDVQRIDLKASRRNSSKSRTALSDIQNMLKGITSETTAKNSKTPSPLQSPLASISLLHKRKSLSHPQNNQFSFLDNDTLLAEDFSTRSVSKQSNEVDAGKNATNVSPSNVGIGDIASPSDKPVNKNTTGLDFDIHASVTNRNGDNCVDDSVTNRNPGKPDIVVSMHPEGDDGQNFVDDSTIRKSSRRPEVDVDMHSVEPNTVEDMLQGVTAAEQSNHSLEDSILGKLIDVPSHLDESNASVAEAHVENESYKSAERAQEQHNLEKESSKTADGAQGQNNEENESSEPVEGTQVQNDEEVHKSSRMRVNKRTKTISQENKANKRSKTISRESQGNKRNNAISRKSKAFSRRKSLSAAGTNWESGVRRSTRIRSRPLEYWKGERFLYGRIHNSLATVIGIKYESPAKGEAKPTLKVRSFVSDEYKELVNLAALH